MREWMRKRKGAFAFKKLCGALGFQPSLERSKARMALQDFIERKEVERVARGQYRYNHSWRAPKRGRVKPKVLKAIYVSVATFSTADIQRLAGGDLGYISRIVYKLMEQGYINMVGRRNCASGFGGENLYRVVNRERFRVEVMA